MRTQRRNLTLLAALAALVTVLGPSEPATARTAVVPDAAVPAVTSAGGEVVERLGAIGQAVVRVTDREAAAVADAGIPIALDREVHPSGASFDEAFLHGADPLAALGLPAGPAAVRGAGVGIAVVDSGIDARSPLLGRVVPGTDVTGRGAPLRDGYGHGTFLAGLLVGVDAPNGWPDVEGVAPGASLTSVKVAGDDGTTSLTNLLQAIDWVITNGPSRGLRVLLLAFGVPPLDGTGDPLHAALEVAWASGLVVVVPTGNQPGLVTSPADDPWLLAVGAVEGTGAAPWSGSGGARPDVLAPGAQLVSASVAGSQVARTYRSAAIGPRLLRGSGTSMAAALVAGAAAIVVAAHPGATPDDVKGALTSTARTIAGGRHVDVGAAVAAEWSPTWEQRHRLDPLLGDGDAMPWSGSSGWTGTSWTGTSWTGTSWTGTSWTGTSWTGTSWTGTSWTGTSWTGAAWQGRW